MGRWFAILSVTALVGCGQVDTATRAPQAADKSAEQSASTLPASDDPYHPNDPGGLGMSYTGKIGFDMGGGVIVTSNGLELGFGF